MCLDQWIGMCYRLQNWSYLLQVFWLPYIYLSIHLAAGDTCIQTRTQTHAIFLPSCLWVRHPSHLLSPCFTCALLWDRSLANKHTPHRLLNRALPLKWYSESDFQFVKERCWFLPFAGQVIRSTAFSGHFLTAVTITTTISIILYKFELWKDNPMLMHTLPHWETGILVIPRESDLFKRTKSTLFLEPLSSTAFWHCPSFHDMRCLMQSIQLSLVITKTVT